MWMLKTFKRQNRSSRKEPALVSACRSRLVAAITRKSTGRGALPPRRVTTFSSSTRSSSTWTLGLTSAISSRKMVPPLAASNLPLCR